MEISPNGTGPGSLSTIKSICRGSDTEIHREIGRIVNLLHSRSGGCHTAAVGGATQRQCVCIVMFFPLAMSFMAQIPPQGPGWPPTRQEVALNLQETFCVKQNCYRGSSAKTDPDGKGTREGTRVSFHSVRWTWDAKQQSLVGCCWGTSTTWRRMKEAMCDGMELLVGVRRHFFFVTMAPVSTK